VENAKRIVGGLWTTFVMIALIVAMGYGIYLMFGSVAIGALDSSVKLPLLTIVGVMILLATLALVALAFAWFGLSDRSQALGLPEGSVRAVIALSLVLLFSILTVFLYSSLNQPPISALQSIAGLNQAQVDALKSTVQVAAIKPAPESKDGFTVYFREPKNQAAEDFAKQLLVLIGTLVTSVTSFYFGSRGAATTQTEPPKTAPNLLGVSPKTLDVASEGPAHLEISGDNLQLITEVKLVNGSDQMVATNVTSNASVVKCDFKIDPNCKKVAWDVVVVDGAGKSAKLKAALTTV
jgi:hypothetical protein